MESLPGKTNYSNIIANIPKKIEKKKEYDFSGTYLFLSYDIVNSTSFKSTNENWQNIFQRFYQFCEKEASESFARIETWKTLGDESLFYIPVTNEKELYEAPQKAYNILLKTIAFFEEQPDTKKKLSVKSTLWAAFVNDHENDDSEKNPSDNIVVKNASAGRYVLDFLGKDIDIGFRISKYALHSRLVIDAKLACLLTKLGTEIHNPSICENMRIVSFEQLKGVWNNRHYPIVWYQNGWDIKNMFLYDEEYNSEIVKKIKSSDGKCLHDSSVLTKIFCDLNKTDEITTLKDGLIITAKNYKGIRKSIPDERLCELHLAAVCINENNEVLVAQRINNKDDLPGKWEFGCCQLKTDQSIKDALINGYKRDFGIDLDFDEEKYILPIGHYELVKEKENDRIVPGLIFKAKAKKIEPIPFKTSKHSAAVWKNIDEIEKISKNDCVPNFHDRIKDAISTI